MLSQIERGLSSPSLNTIRMIANALEVPVFSFFVESVQTEDLIVRANFRKIVTFPFPEKWEYTLLSPDLNGAIEMVLMKLPPGSQSSEVLLRHIGEEVAYVLTGDLVLFLGEDIEILNTGDSVKIPPGIQHKWENRTNKEATVIFAVTPPTF